MPHSQKSNMTIYTLDIILKEMVQGSVVVVVFFFNFSFLFLFFGVCVCGGRCVCVCTFIWLLIYDFGAPFS